MVWFQTGYFPQVPCTCGVSASQPHTEPLLINAPHQHTVSFITLQSTPKENPKRIIATINITFLRSLSGNGVAVTKLKTNLKISNVEIIFKKALI